MSQSPPEAPLQTETRKPRPYDSNQETLSPKESES